MPKLTKTLTLEQQQALRRQTIGHGELTAGAHTAKVSRWTVYNAMKGKPVSLKTYLQLIPLIIQ